MRRLYFTTIIAFMWGAATFAAHADARDDVRMLSSQCDRITDSRVWLDCYYGAAQPMRAQLGLTPAPVTQTRLSEIVAPVPPIRNDISPSKPPPMPRKHGFLGNLFDDTPDPHVSLMPMASYTFGIGHYFTVKLIDGEVWAQATDDVHIARWRNPAVSYLVTILPGILGNYSMHVTNISGDFKVHRVR